MDSNDRRNMTDAEVKKRHQLIAEGGKIAIAEALERHRKLGESIAVWQDGKVVVLDSEQISVLSKTSA